MLQYTDGTIFVGEVNVKNIFTIKAILRLFEVIFGLRMNFHRSSFGTIGVELGEIERYANLLNCRILSIPLVYLGLPIGANPRKWKFGNPLFISLRKDWHYENTYIFFLEEGCV